MRDARIEAFFGFLNERERVRLRKEAGLSFPWTEDKILQSYKFTNVQRHHDRTSRELRERFYNDHFDDEPRAILMNCALFRYFGTWEFAEAIGWQSYDGFDFEGIKDLASDRLASRQRVFTGAYVITNQGISAPKQQVVVDYFLTPLWRAAPEIVGLVRSSGSWRQVGMMMKPLKGFGGSGFMTKETLLDTTYTGFWGNPSETKDGRMSFPVDWMDWTPIGPGARRGAARVLGDDLAAPLNEKKAFDVIMYLTREADLGSLWAHDFALAPHDIQFQLCEFDKYERVRLAQGKPRSRYRVSA